MSKRETLSGQRIEQMLALLKEELIPALGCTEPVAIAYAAARCRALLAQEPESITVHCSGNIIKNAKSVVVPTTGNLRGIEVAAVLGALAGRPTLGMEVLREVQPADVTRTQKLVAQGICRVEILSGSENLHILVEASAGTHTASVETMDAHLHVVREIVDGEVRFAQPRAMQQEGGRLAETLDMAEIYQFARQVPLAALLPVLRPQVQCNLQLAQAGLSECWGAQIGSTLLAGQPDSPRTQAIAYAAAGSDARMGGCVLPVVINSGSGNQGMTASLPVVVVAREKGVPEETMYRALALSNLLAIYQKAFIGKLSAYCGVVSAAAASVCGIAYLEDASPAVVEHTLINTLASVAGMVCDGAKASCAAKIVTALQSAFLGYDMARAGHVFASGDGLVQQDADATIRAVGRMGREGMRSTDAEILHIMLGK